ncbi:MAG: class I SAM-dependent DNA methyltransferase [Caulobacterales bacterium]|nr:class I SAM-dependent DNA methyltransferase [Caulobacterales bacterium]
MTALQFVEKWRDADLRERQGAQLHFIELCDLLGEPRPDQPDSFCFERGVEKAGGGDGWADVWRKGCFAWEYKGRHKDLGAALRQLQTYTLDLQMPPYLVVCDMDRIIVHTNWNNTVSETHTWTLDDLLDAGKRDLLKQVFNGSEKLKPTLSPQDLTAKAAQRFGDIGRRLQERKHDPRTVAHFLNRLIFCMFAEDAGLLPPKLFSRMMQNVQRHPVDAAAQMRTLFAQMHKGGYFGEHKIDWFNGGLFDGEDVLPLEIIDLKDIATTAEEHDWSEIDPAIFGTLFEQALKATRERPALGAHYTDREKILKIVDPVITRPLMAEWDIAHAEIAAIMEDVAAADAEEKAIREEAAAQLKADPKAAKAGEEGRRKRTTALRAKRSKAIAAANERLDAFLDRLSKFRVLDPACGSGNFLYVALHALHDIERRAHGDVLRLGIEPPALRVSVRQLRGIEIERYAAELARVTLWIGDLQWLKKNGYLPDRKPILETLDQIEERDALLDRSKGPERKDWSEAEWPETDVIIGNPPFVGGKRLRDSLGDGTVDRLFEVYHSRVPAEADLVCYWVEKAWKAIVCRRSQRAGLVTTNSVRGGANRKVIEPIADAGALCEAWADEPWILDGAAVRVSQIGFGAGFCGKNLDGRASIAINADLTGSAVDLTKAKQLSECANVAFMGDTKGGAFDVSGELARDWLLAPTNPNGRSNADVLKPWRNGADITRRPADKWIIDFGWTMSQSDAALYEAPFRHVLVHVEPERRENKRPLYREYWWRHVEPRPGMWAALSRLSRFILTPRVATYRSFVWADRRVCPDSATIAIARDDDTTFGILHSRFHELWALRMGTWLGVGNDPRYTPTTTFETFPFPEGLTPNIPAPTYADDPRAIAIAAAARELNEKREAWLNPPEWVNRVPEVVPGYPDRIVPKDDEAAKHLKDRTLTKLYNERPAWLGHLHKQLDAAVATAYGWPADLSDEQILEHLFKLNQERAAAGR